MKRRIFEIVLVGFALFMTGCSADVSVNPVTGTVSVDGMPVYTAEAENGSIVSDNDAGESAPLDYLAKELEASSDHLMRTGEDVDDIYTELGWNSVADTFPSKFDLRERGTITPVKSQNPWGTCWSFATIAASETSILNSLGLTVDSYREKYGEDLDLSEKHLAWFATKAQPELNEYPEGEYPYDESQAGEGLHFIGEGFDAPLDVGGNYFLSSTSLAEGVGILKEKYAPYANSEGNIEKAGDWSLPEEDRYSVSYEVKDVNILPSPSSYDDKDNYVYRPAGTEAIKTELLSGRAVGISFCADRSKPKLSQKELREQFEKNLKDITMITEDEKEYYIDARTGAIDMDDLSYDEACSLVLLRLRVNSMPEDTYDLKDYDRDQLVKIFNSGNFGKSYEEIEKLDNKEPYMTFIGDDPVIYAQYTFEKTSPNHAVTVVGWDDDFAAVNWPENRRPPADGAWIVKNSWDTDWGNEGYFMLSYYDMSLCGIGTFDYIVSEDHRKMDTVTILDYDKMPAEIISSTLFENPVYAANIFEIDDDYVLECVSAMTGDLDTTVTASIYLLNEDASVPTDGVLLDSISETFRYAGYHRVKLNDNLLLPKGSRIGIVVLENVPAENGNKYALINNSSLNKEGVETYNEQHEDDGRSLLRYAKGVVNPGESFVSFGSGEWTDWTEAIEYFGNTGSNTYMAYDNLPIKAYVYELSQVEKVHELSNKVPAIGGEAAVCPEDGYTLIDVTGGQGEKIK